MSLVKAVDHTGQHVFKQTANGGRLSAYNFLSKGFAVGSFNGRSQHAGFT